MAIRYRGKISSDDGDNNNVFWTTMSDLMLGLAIIFITMFVLAMTGFSQQNIEQQKVQMDVSKKEQINITIGICGIIQKLFI